jgi:hypothetical protein
MLKAVYPKVKWDMWRFEPSPRDFWLAEDNRKLFFERLMEENGISMESDDSKWYQITSQQITELGGDVYLRMNNNSAYQG